MGRGLRDGMRGAGLACRPGEAGSTASTGPWAEREQRVLALTAPDAPFLLNPSQVRYRETGFAGQPKNVPSLLSKGAGPASRAFFKPCEPDFGEPVQPVFWRGNPGQGRHLLIAAPSSEVLQKSWLRRICVDWLAILVEPGRREPVSLYGSDSVSPVSAVQMERLSSASV